MDLDAWTRHDRERLTHFMAAVMVLAIEHGYGIKRGIEVLESKDQFPHAVVMFAQLDEPPAMAEQRRAVRSVLDELTLT